MIFTSKIFFLFSIILFVALSSCNIINPAEEIPAYLKIDTFTFSAAPGQGSASQRITDVWVDANYSNVGIYQVPKTFPILGKGNTSLILSPGIWDNGISETRAIYPFYFPDTLTLDLAEKKIYPLAPHFTYSPATKFPLIEDFEAGNIFDKIDGDTNLVRTSDPANRFEGSYSGYIYLDKDHNVYEGRTASTYVLSSVEPVYLEMNYKCDQRFQVGLFANSFGQSEFLYDWNINPKSTWNKIYLNLGAEVAQINADNYQILIRAVYDSTVTQSHIYLDNIKLVTF